MKSRNLSGTSLVEGSVNYKRVELDIKMTQL